VLIAILHITDRDRLIDDPVSPLLISTNDREQYRYMRMGFVTLS
jgi:hypothetical protein